MSIMQFVTKRYVNLIFFIDIRIYAYTANNAPPKKTRTIAIYVYHCGCLQI